MRTNIVIDDKLMEKAMEVTGLRTKKAVVEEGLRALIEVKPNPDLRDLWGTVEFYEGFDYKELRKERVYDFD